MKKPFKSIRYEHICKFWISKVIINTIHGENRSNRYLLQLSLEGHTQSIRINPASFGRGREFDVIIGMDIIRHGLFILDKGKLSFTIDQLK